MNCHVTLQRAWCCREAFKGVWGSFQLSLKMFYIVLEYFFVDSADGQCDKFISLPHKVTTHQHLVLIQVIYVDTLPHLCYY